MDMHYETRQETRREQKALSKVRLGRQLRSHVTLKQVTTCGKTQSMGTSEEKLGEEKQVNQMLL